MEQPEKKRLFYLSWITLVGMSVVGTLLIYYNCRSGGPAPRMISYTQKREVTNVLFGGKPQYLQVIVGVFFGSLSSLFAIMLVNGGRFKEVRYFFEKMVRRINPSFVNIVFVSLCAGIGEEVLFRAGIQPMIGIWWASILFVMLHGYIHPSNLHLTIYGCFLIVICSGFGYLFKIFGLTASVVAHFIYDVSMFSALKYSFRSHPQS